MPVMVVCTSNQDSKKLYDDHGCTYVVQEDFLGGREISEMLQLEMLAASEKQTTHGHVSKAGGGHDHGKGSDLFKLRAADHRDELDEEAMDLVRSSIGQFI